MTPFQGLGNVGLIPRAALRLPWAFASPRLWRSRNEINSARCCPGLLPRRAFGAPEVKSIPQGVALGFFLVAPLALQKRNQFHKAPPRAFSSPRLWRSRINGPFSHIEPQTQ